MRPDDVYLIFAKFVVANPLADYRTVLQHVMNKSGGYGDPDTIHTWYNHWLVLRAELAL